MKRQGLSVTIEELDTLANELQNQIWEQVLKFFKGLSPEQKLEKMREMIKSTKFQINIINKTPKCSDTWRLE